MRTVVTILTLGMLACGARTELAVSTTAGLGEAGIAEAATEPSETSLLDAGPVVAVVCPPSPPAPGTICAPESFVCIYEATFPVGYLKSPLI